MLRLLAALRRVRLTRNVTVLFLSNLIQESAVLTCCIQMALYLGLTSGRRMVGILIQSWESTILPITGLCTDNLCLTSLLRVPIQTHCWTHSNTYVTTCTPALKTSGVQSITLYSPYCHVNITTVTPTMTRAEGY